jgi:hypothetical protein
MTRRTEDGRDIGADYQKQCVQSWKESGFTRVISVNTQREIEAAPGLKSLASELGIEIVPVERDASQIVGRPFVYVADLMKVACEVAAGEPFAFVNADIRLAPEAHASAAVTKIVAPKRFLLSRRTGVTHLNAQTGDQYFWGFDFFGVHPSDAEAVPDIGMIVGAYWWDHYFPLLMCARGAEPVQLPELGVMHLEHDERCDFKLWQKLGDQFLDQVTTLIASEPLASSKLSAPYATALQHAIRRKTRNPLSDFAYHARKRLPSYANLEPEKILRRVAYTNVQFLDQFPDPNSPTPPHRERQPGRRET